MGRFLESLFPESEAKSTRQNRGRMDTGMVKAIRFDFKKASASRGGHSRSSIHPAASYVVFRSALKERENGEEEETRGGGE